MTDDLRPSKTQRKKQMSALQDLGAELVDLDAERLASLDLPEALFDAVAHAQRIAGFEARRRQLQYIGKLMRHVDPDPIRARLDAWKTSSNEEKALLHRVERWRERMLEDESAVGEFLHEHPRADSQQLRALLRNALRERAADRPPASYRALFRLLRETLLAHEARSEEREVRSEG